MPPAVAHWFDVRRVSARGVKTNKRYRLEVVDVLSHNVVGKPQLEKTEAPGNSQQAMSSVIPAVTTMREELLRRLLQAQMVTRRGCVESEPAARAGGVELSVLEPGVWLDGIVRTGSARVRSISSKSDRERVERRLPAAKSRGAVKDR